MINGYDIAYGLGVGIASPFWLIKPSARRKVISAFRQRMGHVTTRDLTHPAVMLHAVSLGEVNATTAMVRLLREKRPDLKFIISTTTQTGWDRSQQLYGKDSDVTLIRYPLDFSSAVNRVLNGLWPSLVVLMELEVWPNFLSKCQVRGIPVVLANGRLTPKSFKRYGLVTPVAASMFQRLSKLCVQEETYAKRFIELGAPPERVVVTGTMKFDTAQVSDRVEGDTDLAAAMNLKPGEEPIWVCGSTGPGEEQIILTEYRTLKSQYANMRLVIVPRKPERFDEVAELIRSSGFSLVRRSANAQSTDSSAIILGDTMGELRKFYSLATVVFVGRTLVDLGSSQHGSDMIEPAALGKPVIVGPFTANFAEAVQKLREAKGIVEVIDGPLLASAVRTLMTDAAIGRRAQEVIRREQGATARHVAIILQFLPLAAS